MSEDVKHSGLVDLPVEVNAGQEYYWLCTCGKSGTGLCDGSHKVTNKTPSQFIAPTDGTVYVCGCTKTGRSTFFATARIIHEQFALDGKANRWLFCFAQ